MGRLDHRPSRRMDRLRQRQIHRPDNHARRPPALQRHRRGLSARQKCVPKLAFWGRVRSYAATGASTPIVEASKPEHRIDHAYSADCARRRDRVCLGFRRIGTEPIEVAGRGRHAAEVDGSPASGRGRRPRRLAGAFEPHQRRRGKAQRPSGQGSCVLRGRTRRPLAVPRADDGGLRRLRDRAGERRGRPPGAPRQVGRGGRRQAGADPGASRAGRARRLQGGRGSERSGRRRQAPTPRVRAAGQGTDRPPQPGEGACCSPRASAISTRWRRIDWSAWRLCRSCRG